ncbi:MAG: hypothetical protein P4M13_01455 [Alphaproteobacteria bacterium]|nr:hypothetical protein [Alphaproteobacteria bacterium]
MNNPHMIWTYSGATALAAFLASLVECVEALTIVLAVGVSRGWRASLLGAGGGLIALFLLVMLFSPAFTQHLFPVAWLQLVIGALLSVFGLRWLRKAVLRAAGIIPLHDERRIYQRHIKQMGQASETRNSFDLLAFAVSFKAVLIEGIEVIFIIVAVSAARASFISASVGAAAALILVMLLGVILHKPLTRVPENSLKFGVGVILTTFGIFWIGEGSGLHWPGGDMVIPAIILLISTAALLTVGFLRKKTSG